MRVLWLASVLAVSLAACDASVPPTPPPDPPAALTGVWAGGQVYDPGTSDTQSLPDTFVVVGIAVQAGAAPEAFSGVGCAEGDAVEEPLVHRSFGVGVYGVRGEVRGGEVTFEMGGPRDDRYSAEWVRFEGDYDAAGAALTGTVSLLRERPEAAGTYDLFLRQPVTLRRVAEAGASYPAGTCQQDYE